MNIEHIKPGMMIKISDDPSYSVARHGSLGGFKQTLAGTIQQIKNVDKNRIYIVRPKNCGHNRISFNIKDIRPVEEFDIEVIKIDPVTFDPNQLDI